MNDHFIASGLPDAFLLLRERLKSSPVVSTRTGLCHEIVNLGLAVLKPLDRLVLLEGDFEGHENYLAAQWTWYSRGQQDTWIKRHHPQAWNRLADNATDINSNYGQYVWKEGQFLSCLNLLRSDLGTRRAVILFNRKEVAMADTQDHICTTSLQFLARCGRLDAIATMRSNELNFGFRTDAFFFTTLQEIMATELGLEVGTYCHNVGSFHVADSDFRHLVMPDRMPWPRYSKGELSQLVPQWTTGTNESNHFPLTHHIKNLLKYYESPNDIRS